MDVSFDTPSFMLAFRAVERSWLWFSRSVKPRAWAVVGLDTRTLALFRLLLGFTTLWDICNRMRDADAHYSDAGIFPRRLAMQHQNADWSSIYMSTGAETAIYALMCLHALSALALTVGYYTRLMTFVCWYFVVSIQARNLFVGHSGDQLHRMCLFIGMLLPLGEHFSIDKMMSLTHEDMLFAAKQRQAQSLAQQRSSIAGASSSTSHFHAVDLPMHSNSVPTGINVVHQLTRGSRWWALAFRIPLFGALLAAVARTRLGVALLKVDERPPATLTEANCTHVSWGAIAYRFQIAVMYYTAYFHKTGAPWTTDYSATWLALHLDAFRRPLATFLMGFPELCKFATFFVKEWQGWGVFLLFAPVLAGPLRLFGVIGFLGMHLGFATSFRLGLFSWITNAAILCLLPGWFWDAIVFNTVRTQERLRLRVFYLRDCSYCFALARFASVFMVIPDTEFVPLELSIEPLSQLAHSRSGLVVHIVGSSTQPVAGFGAFTELVRLSPLWWPLHPVFLRMKLVGVIFSHILHTHSPTSLPAKVPVRQNPVDKPRPIWKSFGIFSWFVILNLLGAVLCQTIIAWNLANIQGQRGVSQSFQVQPSVVGPARAMMWDQWWSMFAPSPPTQWWYWNIEGQTENGTKVELMAGGAWLRGEYNIPHTFDKPADNGVKDDLGQTYRNHRWFKYFENGYLSQSKDQTFRMEWGRWLCRKYLSKHREGNRLKTWTLWHISEMLDASNTTDPRGVRTPFNKVALWQHNCI